MTFLFHSRRFVNPSTIRRRLKSRRIKCRRLYKGLVLTQRRRAWRLTWTRVHARWIRRQWGTVLSRDESKFSVSFGDGRLRVWRQIGERFDDTCVVEHSRIGGGSVHIWGGMTDFDKTQLVVLNGNVNSQSYIDSVLRPEVVPFMHRYLSRGMFQQNNARAYTARASMDIMHLNGIKVLEWPSFSPDLSPIEHLWDGLDRGVRNRNHTPRNVRKLRQALEEEWINNNAF